MLSSDGALSALLIGLEQGMVLVISVAVRFLSVRRCRVDEKVFVPVSPGKGHGASIAFTRVLPSSQEEDEALADSFENFLFCNAPADFYDRLAVRMRRQ